MNSEHLIDPELRAMVAAWPLVILDETILPLIRQSGRLPIEPTVVSDKVERIDERVPGPNEAPEVALIVYRPPARARNALPCIYHIHGGGYLAGSAEMMEPSHRPLVEELGCVLVSVNYRLAPETPYPGPLEDCYAGLAWLFENADEFGIDPTRIGVMGESAGGGLAAALTLLARDRGEYRLAFQHLIAPMLDDRTCIAADPHPFAGDYIWTPDSNRFGWRCYLGAEPGSQGVSPYAAPARMADLTGLPPTFVSTGALDLFVDEDMDYARRLTRAGVETELHVYPGAVHGFTTSNATVARRSIRDSRDALARALARPASRGDED
jgi:triacylglycerol lipase